MDLHECYQLLEIQESAADEEVTKAYKRLAHRYHPDKNQKRIEWATRAMANLNIAYTTVTGHRFTSAAKKTKAPSVHSSQTADIKKKQKRAEESEIHKDFLIKEFIKYRELAKDWIYKYFQYGLYNLLRRDNTLNRGIFNDVVLNLRKCYHEIKKLQTLTRDKELLLHFEIFNRMIFNFYRSSECLNIPDSYSNLIDVEAFRVFKKGDDALHIAHKELFYDRHNRGFNKRDLTDLHLEKSINYFKSALDHFHKSSWAVETTIKLEYAIALKNYIDLFFTDEAN